MRQLRTLTLVLTGMRDRYFPRRYFDQVGEHIPSAEVQDIGSAKHKVQLERHRAVNRSMERFMRGGLGSWRDRRDEPLAEDRRIWHAAYDKNVPHSVPIPRHPVHHFLENTARWLPNRLALVCYGQRMTYAELDARANRLAHALRGLGIAAGERVMLVLPNVPALVLAYYATLKLGGVVVLGNPEATPQMIAQQAAEVGARLVVAISQRADLLTALAELPDTRLLLVDMRDELPAAVYHQEAERRGWPQEASGAIPTGAQWLSELVEAVLDQPPPAVEIDFRQTAVIVYTGGTSGKPRPACLTHRNLVANIMQTRHWAPVVALWPGTLPRRFAFAAHFPDDHRYEPAHRHRRFHRATALSGCAHLARDDASAPTFDFPCRALPVYRHQSDAGSCAAMASPESARV